MRDYIGDGVYAEADDLGGIWLRTPMQEIKHEIYLGPSELMLLDQFRKRIAAAYAMARANASEPVPEPGYADANDND